ncbi:MAG: VWA domain-containing protein [Bacteroidota bacterium]|jgi:Ca-activated chloride channel family protein|nr:VWA domain-containing protein [Bacteroidota bacterium]
MFDPVTQFANPEFLWLLLVIPLLVAWYVWRQGRLSAAIRHSSLAAFAGVPGSWRVRLRALPFALRMLALAALIVAFARPQTSAKGENVYREGIDITIVLDISGSMLAEDFRPNRLEAAKKVGEDFILARESDRIGLVIFAGESFTQCPLTTDYDVLVDLLHQVETGYLQDGTAIGEGIANAVNRMKSSSSKSKVMILLTDGVNNMGSIDPATAAEIARTFGIRVYTIGVGTRGMAPYPFKTVYGIQYQPVPVEIDEEMLRQVAEITGGQYFRATGNRKLEEIYDEIDALERTKIEVTEFHRYTELFYAYVFTGLVLLLTELALSWFVFRKIP